MLNKKQNTKQTFSVKLKELFDENSQIKKMSFCVQGEKIEIFYIEQIIDRKLFSSSVIAPLSKLSGSGKSGQNVKNAKNKTKNSKIDEILSKIAISSREDVKDAMAALQKILDGSVVVVAENSAYAYPLLGAEKRSPEEPPTSRVVKGPREGFVEDIGTNIGLVRKRVKSVSLKFEDMFIGRKTHTKISLVYLEDIAKPDIVEKVKDILSKIDIDAIIDSYYIESFLEGEKIKFFRRVGNTEKPDVFSSKILEGRVGVLVDGSPIALTVPFVLMEDLQSPEDYYTIPTFATFARMMRFMGLIFAILVPGIFVALQSFNYRILPINFLITLLSSIEGLSVPPLVEILIVLFLFEIITEASLQMPNSLGMALSIIGALALGNTAVDAGIISPPSIVIVAISSVALYITPNQIAETRMLRLLFTAIGGIVGLYGIVTAFIILTTYLSKMDSFGVPYLSPLAPSVKNDKKDAFIKSSVQDMITRPELIAGENKVRQNSQTGENETKNRTKDKKYRENTSKNNIKSNKNAKNNNSGEW
ncbi:MAG: spore germination protein [Clostridia bacterium]|nr:spore germination protein [Clostridia bacterium]